MTVQDVRLRMRVNIPPVPQVLSSTCLLSLQADSLGLSNGDPVSVWNDTSGWGRNFQQSGSARPTYRITGGYSYVDFDGIDDFMEGQNWKELDNLPSFTIFLIDTTSDIFAYGNVFNKMNTMVADQTVGWNVGGWGTVMDLQQGPNGRTYNDPYLDPSPDLSIKHVFSSQIRDWNNDVTIYVDGNNATCQANYGGPPAISSISNTTPVRLCYVLNDPGGVPTFSLADMYAVMFYAPAPNDADRSIIEHWFANRYGITLP